MGKPRVFWSQYHLVITARKACTHIPGKSRCRREIRLTPHPPVWALPVYVSNMRVSTTRANAVNNHKPRGNTVNLEKVIFGFFIVLAATLNFGFFTGDIDNPAHHDIYELFAAIVVSLIATVLKLGDRTQIGAIHLSTSLVADLQLLAAAMVWGYAVHVSGAGMTPEHTASVVSLSGGALLANVISVTFLIAETIMQRR